MTKELRVAGNICIALIMLNFVFALVYAQDKPAPPAPQRRAADKQLPDPVKFEILRAYKKAITTQTEHEQKKNALCNADKACAESQKRLVEEVNAYQALVAKAIKDAGLPEGTLVNPNPDSLDVIVTLPTEKK